MVQLKIISGSKAGIDWVARRFPVRLGRGKRCQLKLDDPGIWDDHIHLDFSRQEGIVARVQGDALALVNGTPIRDAILQNGDVLDLGAARVQFWLSPTRQANMAWREWATWLGIAAICALQIALVYWLIR